MAYLKFLPWAGWPIAAVLFFFWLDGRENLAAEVERCNTATAVSAADAANLAREAVTRSYEERLATEARLRIAAETAIDAAVTGRSSALAKAAAAQQIIDELTRGIDDGPVPLQTVCLVTDVPGAILAGMRE